jgi:aromatic amino acid aminotransferase I
MTTYLPAEVCSWTVPAAGMFFWVKITAPVGHDVQNLEGRIFERCLAEKVLIIPGGYFKAEGDPEGLVHCVTDGGECYFRGTFAAAEESEVVTGIQRFGRSLRREFGLSMGDS